MTVTSKLHYSNGADATLILGDAFDVLPTLPANSIDLFVIDPPYVTTEEAWDLKDVVNRELSWLTYQKACAHASLYVWCGIGEKSQSLIRWFPTFVENWHFKDLITWKKQRGIGMRRGWLYTREECMWFVKDNKSFIWNKEHQYLEGVTRKRDRYGIKPGQNGKLPKNIYKRITNVWDDVTELGKDVGYGKVPHYTPKPIRLLTRIIQASCVENGMVADVFMGSGSTGIAAIMKGMSFIGVEKDEASYQFAVDRMKCIESVSVVDEYVDTAP